MQKVIFDTNFIRNTEVKQYFGSRLELEKFYKVSELIFPDIVIEEMRNQKRRQLEKNKDTFLSNTFHWLHKLDEDLTKSFDIENYIDFLETKETLKYTKISLSDYSVLEKMKNLALKKMPPFEASDSTDKGFKDAYIYFTILEYIQLLEDKNIFVCTNDGRLKEALQQEPTIVIIKDYDEFKKYNMTQYQNEYFVEKINAELVLDISKENIVNYWINRSENIILLVVKNNDKYTLEIDSGEITNFANVNEYNECFNDLIKLDNIELIKNTIVNLNNYINFLSNDETLRIFDAIQKNEQMYLALSDVDVRQFVATLYNDFKDTIPLDLKETIKEILESK